MFVLVLLLACFLLNCSLSIFPWTNITAESRLHFAVDCGHGSLVKLCAQRGVKFYDPHTSVDRTRCQRQPTCCLAGHPHRRQLEQWGCWVCKVQIKQFEWRLMWPLWLTRTEARVLMLFACVGWHGESATSCHLQAWKDRPWDNCRRFHVVSNRRRVGLFGLRRWAMHMWDVRSFTILSDLMSLHDREMSLALAYEVRY